MKYVNMPDFPLEPIHVLDACPQFRKGVDETRELMAEADYLIRIMTDFIATNGHDIQDARFKIHRVGETRAEYWPHSRMELEFINALRDFIAGDMDNGWKPKVRKPKVGAFHDEFFQEFLDWYSSPKEGHEYDKPAKMCDPARKDFQVAMRAGKALRDDMPRRICFGLRHDAVQKAKYEFKHSDYSWVPEQYFYLWAEYKHPLPGTEPIERPDLDRCIDLGKRNELEWPEWVPESIKDPDYMKKFFGTSMYC